MRSLDKSRMPNILRSNYNRNESLVTPTRRGVAMRFGNLTADINIHLIGALIYFNFCIHIKKSVILRHLAAFVIFHPLIYIYIYIYILMRVPDYTAIVLHPERFAWSRIHYANIEASTQVPEVVRGMLASLATPDDWTYKLRDMLVTSGERRHRRHRLTCIDVIALDKVNVAGSVTSDRCSCRV